MGDYVFAVLLYGHILSAMAWLGAGILTAFVVGPGLRTIPPAANLEFVAKVMPKILRYFQIVVGSTFVFGILLYFYASSYLGLDSAPGAVIIYAGVALALVVAAIVFSLTLPSFNRLVKLSQASIASGQPPPQADMMKYGKRAKMGALVAVALLFVVVALMVSGTVNL